MCIRGGAETRGRSGYIPRDVSAEAGAKVNESTQVIRLV